MKIKVVHNNLKDLRYHHDNISQLDLADKVGCTRQTINAIEKNKYSPSFLLVSKLAHFFHVLPSDIIQIEFEKA